MDDPTNSRRRRGLGVVTPNACNECRKKRAKCDGRNPCGRCAAQNDVQCIYEVPVRQSKDNMRAEIEQLRTAQRQTDQILTALVSTETSMMVMDQLRNGDTAETIAKRLKGLGADSSEGPRVTTYRNPTDEQAIGDVLHLAKSIEDSPMSSLGSSYASWGNRLEPSEKDASTNAPGKSQMQWEAGKDAAPYLTVQRDPRSGDRSRANDFEVPPSQVRGIILDTKDAAYQRGDVGTAWTSVVDDAAFVEHLLALYFCWEYPTFASLSKEHFLDDFKTGTRRYCSSLLVNAILALGCRFSDQPEARQNANDVDTSGDHFFAEAMRLLELEYDRHSLTTIQALGLMALREASCGRSSESLFLSCQSIRLAVELGLHRDYPINSSPEAEIDHEVRSATFWGAFSLDQAWSLSTGKLPQFSRDIQIANKPAIIQHIEASAWVPYTDDGKRSTCAPFDRPCTQPSNVRSVFRSFCELSEIIHKSLYTLYTPGSKVTSKELLTIYTQYLHWYEGLTPVLRLGHNFTPAVLFVHMHYHFAILLLFRPFIKLGITGSSVSPIGVCAQASDAITALVNSYKQLYTLRRTPSFVPYFVLSSSIAHVVAMSTTACGPEKVRQGLEDLKQMGECHMISNRALKILKFLIGYWGVTGLVEGNGEDSDAEAEAQDIKMWCRPRSKSLNQFCPHMGAADVTNPLKNNDSHLFWPFPMQGRPLLDVENLEDCGFVVLEESARVDMVPGIDVMAVDKVE